MKIDRTRLLLELPMLILYLGAFHVSSRNIHDAFASIARTRISSIMQEARKIAELYLRVFAITKDIVGSIYTVASASRTRELELFLKNYVASLVSKGNVFNVLERGIENTIASLDSLITSRLEIITATIEAIAIVSTIMVFTLAFIPVEPVLPLILSTIIGVTVTALPPMLRLPIIDVYVRTPSLRHRVLGYMYITISVITGLVAMYLLNTFPVYTLMAIALIPLPLTIYMIILWSRITKRFEKDILSTSIVLENIQLGGTSITTLIVHLQRTVDNKELIYLLKTGRGLPHDHQATNILVYSAELISVMLMSGSKAAYLASIFNYVLDRIRRSIKMLNMRAIVYETLIFSSVIALVLLMAFTAKTLLTTSNPGLEMNTYMAIDVLTMGNVDPNYVARVLYLPAALSLISISAITRGKPFYSHFLGLLPLTLVIIAYIFT